MLWFRFCTAKATPRFKRWITQFGTKLCVEAERERERERERRVRTTIQAVRSVLEGGLGLKIAAASPAVHLLCVKQWLFMQRAAPAVSRWGLVWLDECQMPACLPGAPSWVNTPAKPPPPPPPSTLLVCPQMGHALCFTTEHLVLD